VHLPNRQVGQVFYLLHFASDPKPGVRGTKMALGWLCSLNSVTGQKVYKTKVIVVLVGTDYIDSPVIRI